MSRIGKQPIQLPKEVTIKKDNNTVTLSGPKGSLTKKLPRNLDLEVKDSLVTVIAKKNNKATNSLHGTYRSLLQNMVMGVGDGWKKTLEIVGTGYRVQQQGNKLTMNLGFSHPVDFEAPEGITFKVEKNFIEIEGIDKELVGLTAAKIRMIKPPEPYKGKGIRYKDEDVRRKPGKAAKAQGSPA